MQVMTHRYVAVLIVTCTLICSAQTATRVVDGSDQLRVDYVRKLDEFLKAAPGLEKNLYSAPAAQVLQDIEKSRAAAAELSRAKADYYQSLSKTSEKTLELLNSATTGSVDKALFDQMQKRRAYLKEEDLESQKVLLNLRTQRDKLVREKRPENEVSNLDGLIQRAEEDHKTVLSALFSVDNALAGVDSSMKAMSNVRVDLEAWKASQSKMLGEYQALQESAKSQGKLWAEYHDGLKKAVEARAAERKGGRK
jgi:hypothetical protein